MNALFNTILGDRPVRRIAPYIYAVLIVGLFFHPHFSAHIAPFWKPYVEGLTNLIIVGLGIFTYYIYNHEQREFERRFLETSAYIAVVNRKLPLLQEITTGLLSGDIKTAKQITVVFQNLVGIASKTIAQSDCGLMRFVEIGTGRTVKEFWYTLGNTRSDVPFTVGNKELLLCGTSAHTTASVSATRLILAASDRATPVRAFLVIPNVREGVEKDISILQSIVDQGQLLSRYVFNDTSKQYAFKSTI